MAVAMTESTLDFRRRVLECIREKGPINGAGISREMGLTPEQSRARIIAVRHLRDEGRIRRVTSDERYSPIWEAVE